MAENEEAIEFRSPATRARVTMGLLGAAAAVEVVGFGVVLHLIRLNHDASQGLAVPDAAWATGEMLQGYVGIAELTVVVLTAIPFLMWVYRVHRNLHALGERGLTFRPGWAVGWWFIPFANLVQPVRAMLEAWRRSHPRGPKPAPAATVVGLWWAAFLVAGGLENASARLAMNADSLNEFRLADYLYLASSMITVAGVVLAIIVVRAISQWQEAKAREGAAMAFD